MALLWTPRRISAHRVFPLDRLAHAQFMAKFVLKLELNASFLSSAVIKAFIEARLPQSPMIEYADQETVKRKICGTNIYSLTWHQLTLSEFALVPCAQHATSLLRLLRNVQTV